MQQRTSPTAHPDAIELNSWTTTRLTAYVSLHANDRDLLTAVHRVLQPRKGENAGITSRWIEQRLRELPDRPPAGRRRWKLIGILIGTVCAVLAGVAHAAGSEIWKWMWPQLQMLVLGG